MKSEDDELMLSPGGTYATMEWRAALNAAEATHPQLWTAAADLLDNPPEACAPTGRDVRVALHWHDEAEGAPRGPLLRVTDDGPSYDSREHLARALSFGVGYNKSDRTNYGQGEKASALRLGAGLLKMADLSGSRTPADGVERRLVGMLSDKMQRELAAAPTPVTAAVTPVVEWRRRAPRAPWVCEETASSAAARVDLLRVLEFSPFKTDEEVSLSLSVSLSLCLSLSLSARRVPSRPGNPEHIRENTCAPPCRCTPRSTASAAATARLAHICSSGASRRRSCPCATRAAA